MSRKTARRWVREQTRVGPSKQERKQLLKMITMRYLIGDHNDRRPVSIAEACFPLTRTQSAATFMRSARADVRLDPHELLLRRIVATV